MQHQSQIQPQRLIGFRNYYAVLGLEKTSLIDIQDVHDKAAELRQAYKEQLWKAEPDPDKLQSDPKRIKKASDLRQKLRKIDETEMVLSDPVLRTAYDIVYDRRLNLERSLGQVLWACLGVGSGILMGVIAENLFGMYAWESWSDEIIPIVAIVTGSYAAWRNRSQSDAGPLGHLVLSPLDKIVTASQSRKERSHQRAAYEIERQEGRRNTQQKEISSFRQMLKEAKKLIARKPSDRDSAGQDRDLRRRGR
jgi:curved DNA-binding protein CbpA